MIDAFNQTIMYWNVLEEGKEAKPKNYLMTTSTTFKHIAEAECEKWKAKYPNREFRPVRTEVLDCSFIRRRR